MTRRQMKVVRLLEPDLCEGCAFANLAKVRLETGKVVTAVRCTRMDCDNWDTSTANDVDDSDWKDSLRDDWAA